MKQRQKTTTIIFHHSLSPDVSVNVIRDWHKVRGFSDIGYHMVVRKDGAIETGRPLELIGAHAKGRNEDSIGVCITGNLSHTFPSTEQVASCQALYVSECQKRGKQLKIEFHRPTTDKSPCPGRKLNRDGFRMGLHDAYRRATRKLEKEQKEAEMNKKKWYQSKTLWVNILGIVSIIIDKLSGSDTIPPDKAAYALGALNVLLRLVTKKPVSW